MAHSYRVLPRLNAQGQSVTLGGTRGVVFAVRPEERVNVPNFLSTGFIAAERENRLGLEFGLSLGPVLVQAEYMAAFLDGANAQRSERSLFFHGFYVQGSYFLTGENRPYVRKEGIFGAVKPHENFFFVRSDPENRFSPARFGRGACEIALRYSQVDLDNHGIEAGNLRDLTIGLNWYLNPQCRLLWNYLLIWRDAPRQTSDGLTHAFGARFQLEF